MIPFMSTNSSCQMRIVLRVGGYQPAMVHRVAEAVQVAEKLRLRLDLYAYAVYALKFVVDGRKPHLALMLLDFLGET